MWTETTRKKYARCGIRYASDMTDGEWRLIEPLLPSPRRLGRPRTTNLREVVNALLYIAETGCQWRMVPKEFPPYSTVQGYFYRWRDEGLWARINHRLVMTARLAAGREASPSAGVIDSQSVKTTESGGPRGYDAGKKINGRKRHIITDTDGLLLALMVHEAGIQDRDGAPALFALLRKSAPRLRHVFADGAYAGEKLRGALEEIGKWTIEIIKRCPGAKGFEVLPRRWVVERTFACVNGGAKLVPPGGAKLVHLTLCGTRCWGVVPVVHRRDPRCFVSRLRYAERSSVGGSCGPTGSTIAPAVKQVFLGISAVFGFG